MQQINLRRNISGKGAGKGFTLLISNEHINDIIKIIKSVEDSGVLTNRVTVTVKDSMKTKYWDS